MSIFKLDSKIYGAWSVEKKEDVYAGYQWNDSPESPCEGKTQIALKIDKDSNNGKASRVLKKNELHKTDVLD